MEIVCLDLEGVLIPEIWIAFAKATGIKELEITTRDEPDYDKLMKYRINILKEHNFSLTDIQNVIATIKPLDGAKDFLDKLRALTQVVILTDSFSEFVKPFMKQLGWPTVFSNCLTVDGNNMITGFVMRKNDGKRKAVESFREFGFRTFASGDSYNDLKMIHTADAGCLFRAPEKILLEEPDLMICTTYDQLYSEIERFVLS